MSNYVLPTLIGAPKVCMIEKDCSHLCNIERQPTPFLRDQGHWQPRGVSDCQLVKHVGIHARKIRYRSFRASTWSITWIVIWPGSAI